MRGNTEIDGVTRRHRVDGSSARGIGFVCGLLVLTAIGVAVSNAWMSSMERRYDDSAALESLQVVDVAAAAERVAADDPRMEALAVVDDAVVRVGTIDDARAWHTHMFEDEFVFALDDGLVVELRDGDGNERTVALDKDQGVTVPGGTMHRIRASERVSMLVFQTSSAVSEIDGFE